MNLVLRHATLEDAEVCGLISYQAFKAIADEHNFPPSWKAPELAIQAMASRLKSGAVYGVVAELNGEVVGSNFVTEKLAIAGIGPITVDPTAQGFSVGRKLMDHVLARVAELGNPGSRLVQAAYNTHSMSLYAKLGFVVREPLAIMERPKVSVENPGPQVRPALPEDLDGCNELCRATHGHDRASEVLAAIIRKSALVVEDEGRIAGYATSISTRGHAVAKSNREMQALIASAPDDTAGPEGTQFLVPTRNHELFRWCLDRGFRVVTPCTLMTAGLYNEPRGSFLPSLLY